MPIFRPVRTDYVNALYRDRNVVASVVQELHGHDPVYVSLGDLIMGPLFDVQNVNNGHERDFEAVRGDLCVTNSWSIN